MIWNMTGFIKYIIMWVYAHYEYELLINCTISAEGLYCLLATVAIQGLISIGLAGNFHAILGRFSA